MSAKPEPIPIEQPSTLPAASAEPDQDALLTINLTSVGSPPSKPAPTNDRLSPNSQLDQMPNKMEELNVDENKVSS